MLSAYYASLIRVFIYMTRVYSCFGLVFLIVRWFDLSSLLFAIRLVYISLIWVFVYLFICLVFILVSSGVTFSLLFCLPGRQVDGA